MSVLILIPSFRRPFRGWDDPSLPEGSWVAGQPLAGDGTGGVRRIEVLLEGTSQALSGNMYSLEMIFATDDNNAAKIFTMTTANLDDIGGIDARHDIVGALAASATGSVAGLGATTFLSMRAIFLGRALRDGGASVNFAVPNVDLATFEISAMGYIWGPRSITAPGGPQRPAQGLYPN